jgi:MFS family permease
MMAALTSCNTMLQTTMDEDKRGRMMSFYAMAFQGMMPFGNLLAGGMASHIGSPYTVLIGGICCIIASILFATRVPVIRKALSAP